MYLVLDNVGSCVDVDAQNAQYGERQSSSTQLNGNFHFRWRIYLGQNKNWKLTMLAAIFHFHTHDDDDINFAKYIPLDPNCSPESQQQKHARQFSAATTELNR